MSTDGLDGRFLAGWAVHWPDTGLMSSVLCWRGNAAQYFQVGSSPINRRDDNIVATSLYAQGGSAGEFLSQRIVREVQR